MPDTSQKKYEDRIDETEREAIEDSAPITSPALFEAIRRHGESELNRPVSSLVMSGLMAGLALGFCVLFEALLRSHLPDTEWRPLVENFGYTIGFVIVILGQMQLFTENTITAVCPALDEPSRPVVIRLARLWIVVLLSNLVGAGLFGLILYLTGAYQPEVWQAIFELSQEATAYDWFETLLRGIGAGWLIAVLVWMRPNSRHSELLLIVAITYLIALAEFSHVIAGMTEATVMIATGAKPFGEMMMGWVVPALLGNILGGTVFFTLLAFAQIRAELAQEKTPHWRTR